MGQYNDVLGVESKAIVSAIEYLSDKGVLVSINAINKPIQVDSTDANNVYIGYAPTGSSTSAAVWRIQKIVTSGSDIAILSANGSDAFNNIYDDRASLSYS